PAAATAARARSGARVGSANNTRRLFSIPTLSLQWYMCLRSCGSVVWLRVSRASPVGFVDENRPVNRESFEDKVHAMSLADQQAMRDFGVLLEFTVQTG